MLYCMMRSTNYRFKQLKDNCFQNVRISTIFVVLIKKLEEKIASVPGRLQGMHKMRNLNSKWLTK